MSTDIFSGVKGRLGLGCMRFPLNTDKSIDKDTVMKMVDRFLEAGFNYFDTAHGYLDGRSEGMVREALTSRHQRSEYYLADKLSSAFFNKAEDIRPLFKSQLEACGVEYFDYYLMHAINKDLYQKYGKCDAFKISRQLKEEGLVRHVGMSFHDSAEVLRQILSEQGDTIEFVQLQLNYVDWDSDNIQSRLCYETCVEFNKPVIVMEPVKGGTLAQLLPEADRVFDQLSPRGSNASYAMRFVAGLENVKMILSGMSSTEQVEDNIKTIKEAKPLTPEETEAINKVTELIRKEGAIACTKCSYCTEVCPKGIDVPSIIAILNGKRPKEDYAKVTTKAKASDCLHCGRCEKACPQHLPIRRHLQSAVWNLES